MMTGLGSGAAGRPEPSEPLNPFGEDTQPGTAG